MSIGSNLIDSFVWYPTHSQHWKKSLLAGFLVAFIGMHLGWLFLLAAFFLIALVDSLGVVPQYDFKHKQKVSDRTQKGGWIVGVYTTDQIFCIISLMSGIILFFCVSVFCIVFSQFFPDALIQFFSGTAYYELFYSAVYQCVTKASCLEGANAGSFQEMVWQITDYAGVGGFLMPALLFLTLIGFFFSNAINKLFYMRELDAMERERKKADRSRFVKALFFLYSLFLFMVLWTLLFGFFGLTHLFFAYNMIGVSGEFPMLSWIAAMLLWSVILVSLTQVPLIYYLGVVTMLLKAARKFVAGGRSISR